MLRFIFTILVLLPSLASLRAQSALASKDVELNGSTTWVDTGIDVKAGDLVKFEASGNLRYADAKQETGPEGLSRGWKDMIRILPLNDAGRGAVIGRVGDGAAARPFLIGAQRESRMVIGGRLFLGINQSGGGDGSYKVKVTVLERGSDAAATFTGQLPPITDKELAQIPRRVVDKDNNEGDRINFLILGTEDQVKNALKAVGWVIVDRDVKSSILRGSLGVLSRDAYLTMPMSELMVFGRPQDYGYAMSDPLVTVMARHHFRIWKAPFDVDGLTLFVGAGTHDIGFDKDQRTGGVTHKIDPDTDKERDFIGDSLKQCGQVVKTEYVTPKDTITKARTAHGEEFTSDGRILVIYLKPEGGASQTAAFADYFCSVLKQNSPDGEDLGECSQWMSSPGKSDMKLAPIPKTYRLLVIPGIMNTCVSDNPAFAVGRKVLTDKYGLTTDLLSVPNDSSEDNAKMIASYLDEKWKEDQRKFIVVGYSKGTPDLQTALALQPGVRDKIAAFVSVAGASGGSPIADTLPAVLDQWMGKANDKAGCKGNMADGFKSLKKETRQRFLASYPHPFVPSYSVAAMTTDDRVPKSAAQTFKLLCAFDKQNDAQLLKPDQVIPESIFLGTVLSDHLNVALKMGANFPRAALLEAAVRFVNDDLAKRGATSPAAAAAPTTDTKKKSWADSWSK